MQPLEHFFVIAHHTNYQSTHSKYVIKCVCKPLVTAYVPHHALPPLKTLSSVHRQRYSTTTVSPPRIHHDHKLTASLFERHIYSPRFIGIRHTKICKSKASQRSIYVSASVFSSSSRYLRLLSSALVSYFLRLHFPQRIQTSKTSFKRTKIEAQP